MSELDVSKVIRIDLPAGSDGTDATIQAMARASMGEYGAGSARIVALARDVINRAGVPERDQRGEVDAIHRYVMAHLRYIRDPLWYEMITYPETLAFESTDGDCDDHAVLEAALLGAVGIPTRFVTYGFGGAIAQSHVALEAKVGNQWIPLDPIVKDKPSGWSVPNASNVVRYGVNTPTGTVGAALSLRNAAGMIAAVVCITFIWWMSKRRRKGARS